jgi:hypothetical protein
MGGHGSGRWGHHSRRATTRECRVLDAFSLTREGTLRGGVCESSVREWININSGELRWTLQIEVDTRASVDPTIRLKYTAMLTGEQFNYPVCLKTTVPTYGGLKWWFTCPRACGRRVRKLFIAPGSNQFSCRHCHDLSYASRNSCKYTALFNESKEYWIPVIEVTIHAVSRPWPQNAQGERRGGNMARLRSFTLRCGVPLADHHPERQRSVAGR